jgi:hypothetical protein
MKRRGMGINWSCMHTEYSCVKIEVTSCVSTCIWMVMLLQLLLCRIREKLSVTFSGREGMYGLCQEIRMHWGSNGPAI